MRKTRLLAFLLLLPLLGGCGTGESYAKLEELRVIQTLGVDQTERGVLLSLATVSGDRSAGDAAVLRAEGPSLSEALARAERRSTEETLFCGHIRQLVIGADVPLLPLLHLVGRSTQLRLGLPLYLLREGSVEELLARSGSGSRGISEILAAAQAELDRRCDSRAFTAGQVLQDLYRQGSALLCVLEDDEAAEDPSSAQESRGEEAENARTARLAGFAIVRGGDVAGYLDEEALLGVALLRNDLGAQELSLPDRNGGTAAVEIRAGRSALSPVWAEDGRLQGLEVQVTLEANLLEGGSAPLSEAYLSDLSARLEAAVSEQLRGLLKRSKQLQADFLGLGPRVEAAAPLAFHRLGQPFSALLPELEISLSVRSSLQHGSDMA